MYFSIYLFFYDLELTNIFHQKSKQNFKSIGQDNQYF